MSVFTTHPGIDWTDQGNPTLVELIAAVEAFAQNDAEVTATLRHMAETGQVRFLGSAVTSQPCAANP